MIAQNIALLSEIAEVHFVYSDSKPAGQAAVTELRALGASGVYHLKRPSLLRVAFNLFARPCAPLQTHLLADLSSLRRVEELVRQIKPDLIVSDMLRLGYFAENLRRRFPQLPILLDMDDLLSRRYDRMRKQKNTRVLSVFGASLPPIIRWAAEILPNFFLRLEQKLISRAEARIPNVYDAVATISAIEAEVLDNSLNNKNDIVVLDTPPILPSAISGQIVKTLEAKKESLGPVRFVFVGNAMQYANAEALLELDRIASKLKGRSHDTLDFQFEAAGRANPHLALQHVRPVGFVDSLDKFLGRGAVLVVPLWLGTGIKLKILDAAARGVPIITTDVGIESLNLTHDKHVILAKNEAEFVDLLYDIVTGRRPVCELREMGLAACNHLEEICGIDRIRNNLHALVYSSIERRKILADKRCL